MGRGDWIWMPHPGHFICAQDCRFHLNTYVKGVIVSTVGELWFDSDARRSLAEIRMRFDPDKKIDMSLRGDAFDAEFLRVFGYEEIGLNRLYETMVFVAQKMERGCCPYGQKRGCMDGEGYMESKEAYEGHYEMCDKWDALDVEKNGIPDFDKED